MITFRSDFSEYLFDIFYKNAGREQVFGKWMHFRINLSLWELDVITDLLWVYYWKIFEQIVPVAILKKQQPEVICKKRYP